MIWLASYPRSGNTLLRQVLWQTMGLQSFDDVPYDGFRGEWSLNLGESFGTQEALAAEAPSLGETVLAKTHALPRDGERAVYVVRDGRSVIASFLAFTRRHEPERETSLVGLILGDHYHGSWSDHVRAWLSRARSETLSVGYADLRAGDERTVRQLAEFVGHDGPIGPWVNRFEEYRRLAPDEFGAGSDRWEPSSDWDWVADALFWQEHGAVMEELGLDDGRRIEPPPGAGLERILELAGVVRGLRARESSLRAELAEKERVLREVDAERVRQSEAAAERGAALRALDAELARLRAPKG